MTGVTDTVNGGEENYTDAEWPKREEEQNADEDQT